MNLSIRTSVDYSYGRFSFYDPSVDKIKEVKQADLYLIEKELHQLHLDEETLRETLEEQAMDAKAREEKIRQKQADDDEFFLEFGMVRIDSYYESSN
ncbi:hypothetical protein Tco_0374792 [Tanacetum coccineum]